MSSHSVISVNPVSRPVAEVSAPKVLRHEGFADKSDRAMHHALRLILGVSGSTRHARRQWTFRLIIGAVLMCLGLMFVHPALQSTAEVGSHGLALAMITGGALIACGFFTRIVSLSMAVLFATVFFQHGVDTMLGYMSIVCFAFCVMGFLLGSGRYSLDTLVFNALSPYRKPVPAPLDYRAYRRLR